MRSFGKPLEPAFHARAEALIGRKLREAEQIGGGANSRVYRVFDGKRHYAVKLYPRDAGDLRDRLGAELTALRFLRRHGALNLPSVVGADAALRVGVFEWLDGTPVAEPAEADIAAALELLATLHRLRAAEPADRFPSAAEACLSAGELVGQVERRFHRLERPAADQPALAALLTEEMAPVFAQARAQAAGRYDAAGFAFGVELPTEWRSLSPSDFGFHNAIRRRDGSLAFLDFEYFGWDDPVKPVADFLLHPGMILTDRQRRDFAAGAAAIYGADPGYELRLRALFPLYGLRWCLILLNEFLPERWARRVEAGGAADRGTVLAGQLAKARTLLATVRASIPRFPYEE
jgi:hypothetical protein